MFKQVLQNKRTWILPVMAGIAISLISFFLLGAFLSPAENAHNLPLALVNLDRGAQAGPQTLNFGKDLTTRLTAPQPTDTLKWTVADTRESAVQGVKQNKYYAALVIPEGYSAALASLTAMQGTQPATVEMLVNQASPIIGGQIAQSAVQTIIAGVSKATGEQLLAKVQATKTTPALPTAMFLGNPVQLQLVPVVVVGDHSGRSISVFFLGILLTIAGLFSGIMPNTLLKKALDQNSQAGQKSSSLELFGIRAVLYTITGIFVTIGLLVTAWLLNMDVPDWWSLGLFSLLCVLSAAYVVLLCQSLFGKVGLPVAVISLLLLGFPSSGALFPVEVLPTLWQWLYTFLPMHYFVSGLRSVLFLGGDMESGLGTALWVLLGYAAGALVLGALAARLLTGKKQVLRESEKFTPAGV